MTTLSEELLDQIQAKNPRMRFCHALNGMDGKAGEAIVRLSYNEDVQFFCLSNRQEADRFIDAVHDLGLAPEEFGVYKLVEASFGSLRVLSCWNVAPRRTSWLIQRLWEEIWIFLKTEKFKLIGA